MKKLLLSLFLLGSFASLSAATFTKVTQQSQIVDGGKYVILTTPAKVSSVQYGVFVASSAKDNKKGFNTKEIDVEATTMKDSYDIDTADAIVFTINKSATEDCWTISANSQFLSPATLKELQFSETAQDFKITAGTDKTTIASTTTKVNTIQCTMSNGSGGVKGTVTVNNYDTNQKPVFLYQMDEAAPSDQRAAAGISYSAASVTVFADEAASFVAPVLANPNNLSDINFLSSDPDVATVSSNGLVALTGATGSATISASFAGNDEFKAGSASYTITVKATPASVDNVAATIALANNTELTVAYELTVGYVPVFESGNGKNVFAVDAAGNFIQIYGENTYKVGDKIPAGWKANYTLYGITPELVPLSALPAATEGTFTPAEVAAADVNNDLVNSVILIKNVVFADATPDKTAANFTGTVGETTLNFRNNYKLPAEEAGTYDVTVVVTLYKASGATDYTPSLYVVDFAEPAAEPVTPPSSGIDEISASEAAPAEYYNLQGVRVDNPAPGAIYIVRRAGKVAKQLIH